MKRKKVKIFIALLILLNFMSIGIAYAAAESYPSYLTISAGSTVLGKARDYTGSYQSLSISIDELTDPAEPHYLVVGVGTRSSSGTFTQVDVTKMNTILNTCGYWKSTKNVGKTKVAYKFCTKSNCYTGESATGTYYSGVKSNDVVMTSRSSQ